MVSSPQGKAGSEPEKRRENGVAGRCEHRRECAVCGAMPPISTTDALEAGLELGKSPPRAADGGPELSPAPVSLPVIQPMSLCELGPCRNLHVLTQKIDAQRALDGSEGALHVATVRTCYPAIGIEYDLTSEPVKECSRWFPETTDSHVDRSRARDEATIDRWGHVRDEYKAFKKSWEPPPDE